MADGDITSVKVLGRTVLPGGGNTLTGVQVQNKVLVWGQINCSYHSSGIDPASATGVYGASGTLPNALGLKTLDTISFNLAATDGGVMANDALYLFSYNKSTDLIFALEDVGVADAAAPGNSDVLDLRFFAIGDDAAAAELT
jgi:hypothetical protein